MDKTFIRLSQTLGWLKKPHFLYNSMKPPIHLNLTGWLVHQGLNMYVGPHTFLYITCNAREIHLHLPLYIKPQYLFSPTVRTHHNFPPLFLTFPALKKTLIPKNPNGSEATIHRRSHRRAQETKAGRVLQRGWVNSAPIQASNFIHFPILHWAFISVIFFVFVFMRFYFFLKQFHIFSSLILFPLCLFMWVCFRFWNRGQRLH